MTVPEVDGHLMHSLLAWESANQIPEGESEKNTWLR